MRNLDKLITQQTGILTTVVQDPLSAVVIGSGAVLDQFDVLKDVVIQ